MTQDNDGSRRWNPYAYAYTPIRNRPLRYVIATLLVPVQLVYAAATATRGWLRGVAERYWG